jgi:hypothetical protein
MSDESSIVDYQDALMEVLSSNLSQELIFERLKTDPRLREYQNYISKFDPDMVAVACELMGKWAKRKGIP